jgi:hypothetical protein
MRGMVMVVVMARLALAVQAMPGVKVEPVLVALDVAVMAAAEMLAVVEETGVVEEGPAVSSISVAWLKVEVEVMLVSDLPVPVLSKPGTVVMICRYLHHQFQSPRR